MRRTNLQRNTDNPPPGRTHTEKEENMREGVYTGIFSFDQIKKWYGQGYSLSKKAYLQKASPDFVMDVLSFLIRSGNEFESVGIKRRFENDFANHILNNESPEGKSGFELSSIRSFLGLQRYEEWSGKEDTSAEYSTHSGFLFPVIPEPTDYIPSVRSNKPKPSRPSRFTSSGFDF